MPLDINTARSYTTEANLDKYLAKTGLDEFRPLKVKNTDGRWTAVFGCTLSGHPNPPSIAWLGFIIIN